MVCCYLQWTVYAKRHSVAFFNGDLEEGSPLIIPRLILGIKLSNEASFSRFRATGF